MNNQEQIIHPPAPVERSANKRHGWQGGFGGKAERAVLLLLAALPPIALWSPMVLGGGAVPGSI